MSYSAIVVSHKINLYENPLTWFQEKLRNLNILLYKKILFDFITEAKNDGWNK